MNPWYIIAGIVALLISPTIVEWVEDRWYLYHTNNKRSEGNM